MVTANVASLLQERVVLELECIDRMYLNLYVPGLQTPLLLLRTVRNNLFHGGKYPDGPVDEIPRNKAILGAALAVLEGCFELHPGVARRIEEAA